MKQQPPDSIWSDDARQLFGEYHQDVANIIALIDDLRLAADELSQGEITADSDEVAAAVKVVADLVLDNLTSESEILLRAWEISKPAATKKERK